MKVKKTVKTDDKRYPVSVKMDTGIVLQIPQQKEFGEFSQAHGCSLAAVDIALQMFDIYKNADEIHAWAKKHIGANYTGSKLTIYGCCATINGMGGEARWYPIAGNPVSRKKAAENIRKELGKGAIILIEQASPIHTNVILGRRTGGCHIATNGKVKKTTINKLTKEALTGYTQRSKQRFWYKGGQSNRAAGYVVVRKGVYNG